jgi:hypothetical protein
LLEHSYRIAAGPLDLGYNARVLLKSFLDEGLVVAPSALGCGVAADIAWC